MTNSKTDVKIFQGTVFTQEFFTITQRRGDALSSVRENVNNYSSQNILVEPSECSLFQVPFPFLLASQEVCAHFLLLNPRILLKTELQATGGAIAVICFHSF